MSGHTRHSRTPPFRNAGLPVTWQCADLRDAARAGVMLDQQRGGPDWTGAQSLIRAQEGVEEGRGAGLAR